MKRLLQSLMEPRDDMAGVIQSHLERASGVSEEEFGDNSLTLSISLTTTEKLCELSNALRDMDFVDINLYPGYVPWQTLQGVSMATEKSDIAAGEVRPLGYDSAGWNSPDSDMSYLVNVSERSIRFLVLDSNEKVVAFATFNPAELEELVKTASEMDPVEKTVEAPRM